MGFYFSVAKDFALTLSFGLMKVPTFAAVMAVKLM
jgi:hypothetical protein